jgi:hypothetical protein
MRKEVKTGEQMVLGILDGLEPQPTTEFVPPYQETRPQNSSIMTRKQLSQAQLDEFATHPVLAMPAGDISLFTTSLPPSTTWPIPLSAPIQPHLSSPSGKNSLLYS